jgi:hypothetical protein
MWNIYRFTGLQISGNLTSTSLIFSHPALACILEVLRGGPRFGDCQRIGALGLQYIASLCTGCISNLVQKITEVRLLYLRSNRPFSLSSSMIHWSQKKKMKRLWVKRMSNETSWAFSEIIIHFTSGTWNALFTVWITSKMFSIEFARPWGTLPRHCALARSEKDQKRKSFQ